MLHGAQQKIIATVQGLVNYGLPKVEPLLQTSREHAGREKALAPGWAGTGLPARPPGTAPRGARELYKENKAEGLVIVGVRAAESVRRKSRAAVVTRMRRHGKDQELISPIVWWSDADVWAFIRGGGLPYCELYDEVDEFGKKRWKRLGCVLCPMGRRRADGDSPRELVRWPEIARLWKKGIYAAWEARNRAGLKETRKWQTPEKMWRWWLTSHGGPKGDCQGPGLFL